MKRIESIDIFRGLTIALMIFVNDVSSVSMAPDWLHHMAGDADGMTLPDLVFPAFLFIVGMVIPVAFRSRLTQGNTAAVRHAAERSASLLIMGLFLLNAWAFNPDLSPVPISPLLWKYLMFAGFLLAWNRWDSEKNYSRYLIWSGRVLLLFLALIYRRGDTESVSWIQTGWWGILGLIGIAYLTVSILYIFFRNHKTALAVSGGIMILLYLAEESGRFAFLPGLVPFIHPGKFIGTHSLIVLCGLFAGLILNENPGKSAIRPLIVLTLVETAAGWLLHGGIIISKLQATPVWGLYSAAICTLFFTGIYILTDLAGHKKWAGFTGPSARNPLTAYLLPSVIYPLFGLFSLPYFALGRQAASTGIFRSLIFTAAVLLLTRILTRLGVKLKL